MMTMINFPVYGEDPVVNLQILEYEEEQERLEQQQDEEDFYHHFI